MADNRKKLSETQKVNSVDANSRIILLANVTVNASTNIITNSITSIVSYTSMFANTRADSLYIGITSGANTPANSTITVQAGKIWWDASYLYVAVANNTVKRVALSAF